MTPFRIVTLAARGKRGRKARRQAFYSRQRHVRLLQRIMNGAHQMAREVTGIDHAYLDAMAHGMGWVETDAPSWRTIAMRPEGTTPTRS